MISLSKLLVIVLLFLVAVLECPAQPRNLSELPEVPLTSIPELTLSPFGRKALAIHPERWKHSVSDNFVYHYFDNFVATSVSVESEYYYNAIARELDKLNETWERKCHIFIFQTKEDWKTFQGAAKLDPWTGGIQQGNELFLIRDVDYRWKDQTLGHEIAHLVVNRFYEGQSPLWINEGYAENVALRNFQTFLKSRGLVSGPVRRLITATNFIPLAELTTLERYPEDPIKVAVFYEESELLVRFLINANKAGFLTLMKELSQGVPFETALSNNFADKFYSVAALEDAFKPYAIRNLNP